MPKDKKCTELIPRIYKKNAENLMLFSWVTSQRQIIPTITVDQAIYNFFKHANIDNWDIECARNTFLRMQKEYFEDCES